MPKHFRFFRNAGFTLVELLVVIGILFILLIMGMRVYRSAIQRARLVQCTFNLRQLGIVLLSYANENDGILPAQGNNGSDGVSWSITLMGYMQERFPKLNERTIQLCPAALDTFPNRQAYRSYMMSYEGYNWKDKTRLPQHTSPAKSVILLDAAHRTGGDCYSGFHFSDYKKLGDWRHGSGINALFLDGHVKWFSQFESQELDDCVKAFGK